MLKTARVKNVISNPDVTPEILTYDSEAAAISNDSHVTSAPGSNGLTSGSQELRHAGSQDLCQDYQDMIRICEEIFQMQRILANPKDVHEQGCI